MQDKIESLCEMAKKVGVSDKTVEMIRADLLKDMEEDKSEDNSETPIVGVTKVAVESTGKPSKDEIKKALELLSNQLGN